MAHIPPTSRRRTNNHILNENKKWRKQQMAKEYRETDDRETNN
jgi:hypothetical protein